MELYSCVKFFSQNQHNKYNRDIVINCINFSCRRKWHFKAVFLVTALWKYFKLKHCSRQSVRLISPTQKPMRLLKTVSSHESLSKNFRCNYYCKVLFGF